MPLAARFDALGGPEVLTIAPSETPEPGPGEVRVAMRAAGLNRAELLFMAGRYLSKPSLPGSRIGVEGAGVVDVVGEGVEGFAPGDRVAILPMLDFATHGVLGQTATVPAAALEPIPEGVGFEDAAAFWMAFGTAYGMMVTAGGLREGAGRTVVVTGASSSVGLAAFQVARALGATTIATTRTGAKADALRAAGADHVVATEREDLGARIREITDGRGFDLACDTVAGPVIGALAEAAADEGTIVCVGIQSGEVPPLPFYPVLSRGVTLTGFHLFFRLLAHPERRRDAVRHLSAGLAHGTYRPAIDAVFDLAHAADAYRRMASNDHTGKIVVRIRD